MRGESPGENVKRKSGEREIRVEGDKEGRDFEGETEKKSTERENALEKLVRRTVRGERNVGKLKIEDGDPEKQPIVFEGR